MTSPCTLRFEPDTAKGPGYGLILASCPGLAGNADSLLFLIRNTAGQSLGPNGWQPGDGWLNPESVQAIGETFLISVGPNIVNWFAEQTSYQLILFIDMEHVWQGMLDITRLAITPPRPIMTPAQSEPLNLLPKMEAAPIRQEAAQTAHLGTSLSMPAMQRQTETPAMSLSLDGNAASAVCADELLVMAERPKHYWGAVLNVFFAILTALLLAAAGYFIYTQVLPKTQLKQEEPAAEILKQEAADVKPGTEVPVTYAPEDLKGSRAMSVARDAVKRKIPAESALSLAKQLLAASGDAKAQDAGRLILDDLAEKNNPQALLMLGDAYSPSTPPSGTLQKNAAFARDCYKKAQAAGAPEAQTRLDQLR